MSEEAEEECIYITDFSPFTEQDMKEFRCEMERLNHCWKPQYQDSG